MKHAIYILAASATLIMAAGCSKENGHSGTPAKIDGFTVKMADADKEGKNTKASPDYSVNTTLDPTSKVSNGIPQRTDWLLDVKILFSGGTQDPSDPNPGNVYETTCARSTGSIWIPAPGDNVHLPNYTKRYIEAVLYPAGWTASTVVAEDQSSSNALLTQDILEQPGTDIISPEHILQVDMSHRYSMLDFIIDGVNPDEIVSVTVVTGTGASETTYIPYKVQRTETDAMEYLVILPLAVTNPKVVLKTADGVTYYQTLDISGGTVRNTCYCVTFAGLELELAAYNVENWINGEAQHGNYTTITSFPTFKGPAGQTVTLFFDNGLHQDITFNDKGESTTKPYGRIITRVVYNGNDLLTGGNAIMLQGMAVDLSYLFP